MEPTTGQGNGTIISSDDDMETDDDTIGGNPFVKVNKMKGRHKHKIQFKKQPIVKLDALKSLKVVHNKVTGLEEIVIPVANKYGPLASAEKEVKDTRKSPSDKNKKTAEAKVRIPPITLPDCQRSAVINQLRFVKITAYKMKITSQGLNVIYLFIYL